MGQQQDQGRNQKIPWHKWKWEYNPKSVAHRENNPRRAIHGTYRLISKTKLKKKEEKEKKEKFK